MLPEWYQLCTVLGRIEEIVTLIIFYKLSFSPGTLAEKAWPNSRSWSQ